MTVHTANFEKWGFKELSEGADLLKLYAKTGCDFLTDGITLNFNDSSSKVFLSDEDFNVGVEEDGKLVQFFSCPECGFEGTASEAKDEGKDFEEYQGSCSKECFKHGTE